MLSYNVPGARFGNYFFFNSFISFMSKKYNLKASYEYKTQCEELGMELYSGSNTEQTMHIFIHDDNFIKYLTENIDIHGFGVSIVKNTYFQTKEFVLFLKNHYRQESVQTNIIDKNKYKNRYNNNNDLFVHVRLGDTTHLNPGIDYYDNIISKITFTNGFISSDSKTNPIVQTLIHKHNLEFIETEEIETIQFASTCKHLILSNGTFSWLIGFLGFYSTVYYPDPTRTQKWHGDIFCIPEWIKI
jgi:hypothetical protein